MSQSQNHLLGRDPGLEVGRYEPQCLAGEALPRWALVSSCVDDHFGLEGSGAAQGIRKSRKQGMELFVSMRRDGL